MFVLQKGEEKDVFLKSKLGRALTVNTSLVPLKATRSSQGVQVLSLKAQDRVEFVCPVEQMKNPPLSRYKKTKIPSAGGIYNEIDMDANQTTLI
jgi:DNA gyrase subunit A